MMKPCDATNSLVIIDLNIEFLSLGQQQFISIYLAFKGLFNGNIQLKNASAGPHESNANIKL